MRTTAYVFCAGVLCWPCVAPCSSMVGPSKMTARVRYLRSTTETERKPAQGADDVLKLHQPTLCLDSRQLTASLSLIGCTSLLAESGILRTQAGGDGSGDGHTLHYLAMRRIKYCDYALDSARRLRHRRPAAPGQPGRWHPSFRRATARRAPRARPLG